MRMSILNYSLGNSEWTLMTAAFFSKFFQAINLIIHQYKSVGKWVTSNSLQAFTLSKSLTNLMLEKSVLSKSYFYDQLTDYIPSIILIKLAVQVNCTLMQSHIPKYLLDLFQRESNMVKRRILFERKSLQISGLKLLSCNKTGTQHKM